MNKLISVSIVPPILPSAALIYTSFRSVLNMCHWNIAPLIAVATATSHSFALQSDKIGGALYYRDQLVDTLVREMSGYSQTAYTGGFCDRSYISKTLENTGIVII